MLHSRPEEKPLQTGQEDGSLLEGCFQDKTSGTDPLPDAADYVENDFPAQSHQLEAGTRKIKLVKKEI